MVFQTFATKTWHFQTFATMMIRRDFSDGSEVARPKHRDSDLVCPDFRDRKTQARLSRPKRIQCEPAFQKMARSARPSSAISRLSRPRWRRRAFPGQYGDGATKKKFSGLPRPMSRRRDFRNQSGYGATQKAMARPAWSARQKIARSRLSLPRWRRRDYPDRGGDNATKNQLFVTVVEAARCSRSEWKRRDFPDQGGGGAAFQDKAEAARLSRTRRRRCDQEHILRDRRGSGATFAFTVGMARFPDQGADAVF